MAEAATSFRRQKVAAVLPLVLVIAAALIWSGFATYHHAVDGEVPPGGTPVPGGIAWTLIAALDGTVVVTTPVWLSTHLPAKVRNYAAALCVLALAGSMYIGAVETGVQGAIPPLIAGGLIHLVGVVLRAYSDLERDIDDESTGSPVTEKSEDVVPPVEEPPVVPAVEQSVDVDSPVDEKVEPFEIVSRMLNKAYALGDPEPTGPELTEAVRAAGYTVNDNYGRTAKARWKKQNERVTVNG